VKPTALCAVAAVLGAAIGLSSAIPRADQHGIQPGVQDCPIRMSPEASYWWNRALGKSARNAGPAILVSRFRFQRLRPLKSWQDVPGLRDYVEWADRAEAAGFRDGAVIANISVNDMILLRMPAASVECAVPVYRDPIGFAVLDPGRAGWVRIPVTLLVAQAPVPALAPGLPVQPVPVLQAVVAADGVTVVAYGDALMGSRVRIFSRAGEGAVLYDSPSQINGRVRSLDQVSVEVDGIRSEWAEVRR
jgi:hypothetical protein